MTSKELRKAFLDYFKDKGHEVVPSSPLIPQGDPSMLFTTAGMVQFKPHFAGEVDLTYTRSTSCQKCLRTTDLDNVGKTPRHHTFFEMLGNFSFGDYFKKGAIEFAWEFSLDIVKLDKEKIWASIYEEDDEAFEIWNKHIGLPTERIVRLGKEDNFWGPAGDTGACGPCSELYYDLGEEFSCGDENCKPGCDCNRYIEYWNLVFNQYNYTVEGEFKPLPMTGIDTGMGLERLCLITQGVKSVYQTDLFAPFIKQVEKMAGKKYEGGNIPAFNVIADHIRAVTFVMAEGILPSNEGRGYVIRRILRRAIRFGKVLGIEEPFMYRLVEIICGIMGEKYPEIIKTKSSSEKVIKAEEERFFQTLNQGVNYLNTLISNLKDQGKSKIPGDEAFKLYDTMGFPIDLTLEIANDAGLEVNKSEFDILMEEQRERGREQWKVESTKIAGILQDMPETEYLGEKTFSGRGKVLLVFNNDGQVSVAKPGDDVMVVTDKTPFYGESGGQTGDTGSVKSGEMIADVIDTKKLDGVIYHFCKIKEGEIKKGMEISAEVDDQRKKSIARNHSVTHLTQKALKMTLGDHVRQLGSQVLPDRMRFDFSHFSSLQQKEIEKVEEIVNRAVLSNLEVDIEYMDKQQAVNEGALAFFGDKYGDTVRVVKMGDFSTELCGGTHVKRTGDIGFFKIVSESSISSGTRRIECVTGMGALKYVNENLHTLSDIEEKLNVKGAETADRVEGLVHRVKELEKQIKKIKAGEGLDVKSGLSENEYKMGNFNVLFMHADVDDAKDLRVFNDRVKNSLPSYISVLYFIEEGKIQYLCSVSKDNVEKGVSAGEIIKVINQNTNGRGGGKPVMAQGGGEAPQDIETLKSALKKYFEGLS